MSQAALRLRIEDPLFQRMKAREVLAAHVAGSPMVASKDTASADSFVPIGSTAPVAADPIEKRLSLPPVLTPFSQPCRFHSVPSAPGRSRAGG